MRKMAMNVLSALSVGYTCPNIQFWTVGILKFDDHPRRHIAHLCLWIIPWKLFRIVRNDSNYLCSGQAEIVPYVYGHLQFSIWCLSIPAHILLCFTPRITLNSISLPLLSKTKQNKNCLQSFRFPPVLCFRRYISFWPSISTSIIIGYRKRILGCI